MKNGHKLIIGLVVLLLVIILAFQSSGFMTPSNNSTNNTTQSNANVTTSQVSQKSTINTQDQVVQAPSNPQPEAKGVTCSICNGKGYYTCPICHGTGIDPQTGQKCEGGQPGCNGGIVHCYTCNGDGRMDPGDGTMM